MLTKIIKRDGREVNFSIEKIANAIFKAAQSMGGKDYEESLALANQVVVYLENRGIQKPTVEQVQDAVEKVLIENGHARTAKVYILYRAERSRVREMNTRLMKIYEGLTFKDAKDNDIKRENANIDGDTAMGTMLKYGSEGAKQFNELFVLNPEHSKAHHEGDIHIHDLDFLTLTTTCCQIDIIKLFKGGFSTGHGYLREPNDIASYSALACIAIQSNQNDQHGGQSIPNFDYGMALDQYYFANIWSVKDKLFKKRDLQEIIKAYGNKFDMLNLQWIYRSRRYYHMAPADIYALLIPVHYKLSHKEITALVEAADNEEFRRVLDTTAYKKRYPELAPENLEEYYTLNLRNILESEARKYPHSVIMIYSYFYHKEHEVDRLTTAIECIRYGLSPAETLDYIHKN